MAYGWLNLSPEQLDNLTPRELSNKLAGFEKLEEKRSQDDWYKFRMLASTLLAPHTKNGRGIKPEKLWPFHWEKKQSKANKMSKQRLEYLESRSKLLKNGR